MLTSSDTKLDWQQIVLSFVLVAAVAFIAYSNMWHAPFTFDDIPAIPADAYVPYFSFSAADFKALVGTRGLRNVTLGINYYFSGLNVVSYHVVNFSLHVLNGLLVFTLAYLLARLAIKPKHYLTALVPWSNHFVFALFAALLFVSHPIQTMAVTYIVQRSVLLATLFYLVAMIAYIQARRQIWPRTWWAITFVAMILALLSREISATIPLALALIEVCFFSQRWRIFKHRIPSLLPFFILVFFIPLFYLRLLPFLHFSPFSLSSIAEHVNSFDISRLFVRTGEIQPMQYLLTEWRVIMQYLRLVVLPIGQNIDHDVSVSHGLFDPMSTMWSLGAIVALLGSAAWLFKRGAWLLSFGIFFFFLALSVESTITLPDPMFEYRLYLPMIGLVLGASFFLVWLWDWLGARKVWEWFEAQYIFLAVAGLLIIVLGAATYERNTLWRDPETLWLDAVAKSPQKSRPRNNLGITYLEQGRWDEALAAFEEVIHLDPEYSPAYNNLGLIYTRREQLDKAESYFNRAIELDPDYAHAHNNLGAVYVKRGDIDRAGESFARAAELSPRYVSAIDNLGMIYFRQKRYDEAEDQFQRALEIDPLNAESYNNLGVVYFTRGQLDDARRLFRKSLDLDPNNRNAQENLKLIEGSRSNGNLQLLN